MSCGDSGFEVDDVIIILGTRPEAIKLAGIARQLGDRARIVHTGQHFDRTMWHDVLKDLAGVQVSEHISVGGRSRGEQIGDATSELTKYLTRHPGRAVVVQGDTNSTLAGALAASSVQIPVVHVEAGLRSGDRRMPEEVNRILVDAIADLCCAPLQRNADQLRSEGVLDDRVVVTGNTLADALESIQAGPDERHALLARHGVKDGEFVLSTLHRPALVDDPQLLGRMGRALAAIAELTQVLLPVHPRTARHIDDWRLRSDFGAVRLLEPMPPIEFTTLESAAGLIVSDSGGVQEEACLFRRPLLVVRDSTERPELLEGWCRLLGNDDPSEAIMSAWSDATEWRASLQGRALPYQTAGSQAIIAEIDARWPARGAA